MRRAVEMPESPSESSARRLSLGPALGVLMDLSMVLQLRSLPLQVGDASRAIEAIQGEGAWAQNPARLELMIMPHGMPDRTFHVTPRYFSPAEREIEELGLWEGLDAIEAALKWFERQCP